MKILIILVFLFSSCVHRSTLMREDDNNKKYAVEYCGGQIWGYVKPIDKSKSALLAVYTNYTTLLVDKGVYKNALVLNIAFRFKNSTKLTFKNKKILINYSHINKPDDMNIEFWLIESFKSVRDKFSSNKYDIKPGVKEREYLVYKQKYSGFFGSMFLEDPFVYNQPFVENKKVESVNINFNADEHDDFILIAKEILFVDDFSNKHKDISAIPDFTKISFTLPEFTLNDVDYKLDPFFINFDKNKINKKSKSHPSCPSLSMMFHWNNGPSLLPVFMID